MARFNTKTKDNIPLVNAKRGEVVYPENYEIKDNTTNHGNTVEINMTLVTSSSLIDEVVTKEFLDFVKKFGEKNSQINIINQLTLETKTTFSRFESKKEITVKLKLNNNTLLVPELKMKVRKFLEQFAPAPYMGNTDEFD
ncbi:MAG: hypothetical protein ACP5MK_03215 [Candidatus Micrarchaeia archaeon]